MSVQARSVCTIRSIASYAGRCLVFGVTSRGTEVVLYTKADEVNSLFDNWVALFSEQGNIACEDYALYVQKAKAAEWESIRFALGHV